MPDPRVNRAIREYVYTRANGRCEYCLCPSDVGTTPYAIDHVVPRASQGPSEPANLALSCQGCNSYKAKRQSAVDPVSERRVPLYNPRRDQWHEHFAWSADGLAIVGLTPRGRATVDALRLNREPVVNLRRLLASAGEHPPRLCATENP